MSVWYEQRLEVNEIITFEKRFLKVDYKSIIGYNDR